MSSIRGSRIGICIMRCGPLTGVSTFFCPRQRHNVALSCWSNTASYSSYVKSALADQKPWKIDLHSEIKTASSYSGFITDTELVKTVSQCLQQHGNNGPAPIIMECNPGPGVLTRALLDANINVVALERHTYFLPSLKRLQDTANGRLKVVHCDFFKLDPWSQGLVQPPSMYSSTLMKQLGISEVPWAADIPIKVFVTLNPKKERSVLWRQIFRLYEQLSIYRFGRIELNVFMSENLYKKLISKPGDFKNYQALAVLYQAACDIELLHKEPWDTFLPLSKWKGKPVSVPNGHLCLVRLTPRRNLFSDRFTPEDGNTFIHMVKQFLAARKSCLIDRLNSFDPGSGERMLERLALPKTIATGNIYPEEYKFLFEIMSCSEEFIQSFVLDGLCEDIACKSY